MKRLAIFVLACGLALGAGLYLLSQTMKEE